MHKNQKGFGHLGVVVIVIVISLIGLSGWFVYSSQNSKDSAAKVANTGTANEPKKDNRKVAPSLKTYANDEYGMSFSYPSNWSITEQLEDIGRGANEGQVSLVSPYGTKIIFNLDQGGKGGDCIDEDAGDIRTTRTCTTVDYIDSQKILQPIGAKLLYLYKAKVTESEQRGGSVAYRYAIGDTPMSGSQLQSGFVSGANNKKGYITIAYTGKNDAENDSMSFFMTQEAKEISEVLQTLKIDDI